MTLLHYVIQDQFDLATIKFLLAENQDIYYVNKFDNKGYTPLHLAMFNPNNQEIVKLLVENNADVNLTTKLGYNSLHLAIVYKCSNDVLEYLIKNGANVHAKSKNGYNVLHLAVALKCVKNILTYLIEQKVDLNAKTNYGFTPLDLAIKYYNKDTIELLMQHGANQVQAYLKNHMNPLYYLAIKNKLDKKNCENLIKRESKARIASYDSLDDILNLFIGQDLIQPFILIINDLLRSKTFIEKQAIAEKIITKLYDFEETKRYNFRSELYEQIIIKFMLNDLKGKNFQIKIKNLLANKVNYISDLNSLDCCFHKAARKIKEQKITYLYIMLCRLYELEKKSKGPRIKKPNIFDLPEQILENHIFSFIILDEITKGLHDKIEKAKKIIADQNNSSNVGKLLFFKFSKMLQSRTRLSYLKEQDDFSYKYLTSSFITNLNLQDPKQNSCQVLKL